MLDRLPADKAWSGEPPDASAGRDLPVGLHPMVTTTAVAGIVWSILVSWAVFFLIGASPGELVILTVITVVSSIPAGAVIGLSWHRYVHYTDDAQAARVTRRPRDFRDFLNGEMEVATGRITGRDAYWFAFAMGLACAIFGTGAAIGIGIGIR